MGTEFQFRKMEGSGWRWMVGDGCSYNNVNVLDDTELYT